MMDFNMMIEGKRKREHDKYQKSSLYIITNDEQIDYRDDQSGHTTTSALRV